MKNFIALFLILILVSCGSKEDKINREFSKMGTADLMEEIEKDSYTPPKDFNLTEKQVEMYIKVKDEELVYAKQAAENLKTKSDKLDKKEKDGKKVGLGDYVTAFKALGDAADFVTADLRAAKKMGYNAKEFQWVKEIIIKTKASEGMESAITSANETYSEMLKNLKKQRAAATTKEMKEMFDQQIKAISETVDEMQKEREQDECITEHNKKLLAKYKDKIINLESEINKWRLLDNKEVN